MMERSVPWWRRALGAAFSGIRSGFGLFRRNGKAVVGTEVARQAEAVVEPREAVRDETQAPEEESQVMPSSPHSEPAEAKEVVEPKSSAQPADELSVEPQDVKGHDFSRALSVPQSVGALAPAASLPSTELEVSSPSASPDEPAIPTPAAAGETTPVAQTASAEEMTELLEIAAPPAPEEAAAPVIDSNSEDATTLEPNSSAEPEPAQAAHVSPLEAPAAPPVEELAETPARDSELPPVTDPVLVPEPPVTEPPTAPEPPASDPPAPEPPEPPPLPMPEPLPAPPVTEPPGPEPAGPDPLPAPVPIDAAPTLPFPEKPQRTTQEKVAAALKAREARGEDADQSPFSVIVNQVYDGPLDLLLDLIRKQDIDIYDIPIAKITAQFLAYVDQLRAGDMDVAGDFIYTAALLIHIKSRMLLPRAPSGPDDAAEDPRQELVERLLEHERFKNAAQMLHEKQMLEAATWTNPGIREFQDDAAAEPEIAADTTDLVRVFSDILERARNRPILNLEEESVTVGQMIQFLARRLTMEDKPVALRRMLSHTKSERALIAMFLALLELVRLQAILLRQDRHFSEIFIKKHSGFDALMNQGLTNARDDWR
jgi:segregation and condensation protein A